MEVVQVTKRVPNRLQAQGVLTSVKYFESMQRIRNCLHTGSWHEAARIVAACRTAAVHVELKVAVLLQNCVCLDIVNTNRQTFLNHVDEAMKLCSEITTDNYVCLRGRCELVLAVFYWHRNDNDKALEHIRKAMEIQYNLAAGEDTALTNYSHACMLLTRKNSVEETKKTELALEYAITHCRTGDYGLKDSYPLIRLAQLHLGSYPSHRCGRNDDPDSIMKARSSLQAVSMEHLSSRTRCIYLSTISVLCRYTRDLHQANYYATLANNIAEAYGYRFETFPAKERLHRSDAPTPEHRIDAEIPEHANEAATPQHASDAIPEHANPPSVLPFAWGMWEWRECSSANLPMLKT